MQRFITLVGNKIISSRTGNSIAEGEIESDTGGLGQLMQEDGTFIDDPQDLIDKQQADIEAQKQELINQMITANALRDDVAWAKHKASYDKVTEEEIRGGKKLCIS